MDFLGNISVSSMVFMAIAALCAGLIDAIAGGGGLIQLPALLIGLPQSPTVQVLGTNKLSSIFGTSAAALMYGAFRHDWVHLRGATRLAHSHSRDASHSFYYVNCCRPLHMAQTSIGTF